MSATLPAVSLASGESMLAQGPEELNRFMASTLELAIGSEMTQLEVRYKNLSVMADITITEDVTAKSELPTLFNTVAKALARISPMRRVVRKEIIKNASGLFKPGTITLVLGQPGSGKSALMKMLSGQFPVESNIAVEGEITYNGVLLKEIIERVPQFVEYVPQTDRHFATLTTRETLEYAHKFVVGGLVEKGAETFTKGSVEENLAALEAAKAYYKNYPDIVIGQLGLQDCENTVIGNALVRGVSGGERKRVTTGEMEFGMKYVSLMDEISTGLDSAATFDIICTQRNIAKTLHKAVAISLLQPAPEVFALFDYVLIMNEGEVMYHGPRDQVLPYFESLGFKCPPDRDIADYLLDLGTRLQHQYEVALPVGMIKHPRAASEFAEHFVQSRVYADLVGMIEAPMEPELEKHMSEYMDPVPEFRKGFWQNTAALSVRHMTILWRNKAYVASRVAMTCIMGLIYGSTFYQVDPTNVQVMLGVIFQAVMFMSLSPGSQIPVFMEAREIFYKQRGANFYQTASYVIDYSIALMPPSVFEILIFGSLVYWMCGFVANVGAYFIYLTLLVLTNLVLSTWFFALTAMCPNLDIAKPMSSFSIVFIILFAGFLYWLNPIGWCMRALSVNEYRSSKYNVCEYGGIDYCSKFNMNMGEYYLDQFGLWTGAIFLIVFYVLLLALSTYLLEYRRYLAPTNIQLLPKEIEDEAQDVYALATTPKHSDDTNSDTSHDDVMVGVPRREKSFVRVTIAFTVLWYTVPDPTNPKEGHDLLKGINGCATRGTLTALMGSTGAGKTTLMDVIAGRKKEGTIQGKIYLNGCEANDLAIRRATGYCEQMDIHSEASTMREALTFSAFLRQDSSVPDSKKYDTVEECLDLLDMHDIADQIVRGSSQEQMKRLTIGVELAAQPSILFLDEPTSGLDAHSAKVIMDGVRKVADSGRTIVCTIHQPSSDVFFLFDHLILLKRGGQSVFVGELGDRCQKLVKYLEAIPGVKPCPPKQNPATWMLEVIGTGVSSGRARDLDFVDIFSKSQEKRMMDDMLQQPGITTVSPDWPEVTFTKKRASKGSTQLYFLMKRFFALYWRTPAFNLTRFAIVLGVAIICGLAFLSVDYSTYSGLMGGVGLVFMSTLFMAMAGFMDTLPVYSNDRAAFYRERASQCYNSLWYFVATTVVEIPYVFGQCLLFTVIFYPMVGFQGFATAVLYWVHVSLFVLGQMYFAQLLIHAFPSIEVAAVMGALINSIFLLFAGFNPPSSSIPEGYKWLYTIVPQRFSVAILTAIYKNIGSNLGCQPLTEAPITVSHTTTVKGFIEGTFSYNYNDRWSNFGYVFAAIFIFRVLSMLSLRYINHTKR
ncbi:pleiotropic drug resistance protein ABC superfamily [Phytophthora sojae]|uniref:Pleiotropic drug resistance protein ABC superfamily n=1 Tax=Phytophthora sojae (strain P6497) TaxID=1094619 RepID=G4ZSV9_PHYSP|nr:pleiotropic drug resistance protein ABC superfamily [Phytophthora sojae]EGZ13044.1 pleiotropic drug resistance protein ABC superfamily [Phytophthora sojae]|eukprot:XP_009530473.1 pleiotropic drug resistance protein ABC superfamily [Phytophthora sojae]